ncbi:BCCT family transporter [Arthrobacter rhombi]|uniref:High-affinity choline uptake protein BetT n=2 Tax=Arthrobacter rhombi TaxID=71253 RepID=A0A1R4GAZ7_9MICC|nr:BCCT family transporter [Arthrobacter rhombi]SJM65213.1 High-affinity choline uptake protein BetT [Arthrobacter rhombi]
MSTPPEISGENLDQRRASPTEAKKPIIPAPRVFWPALAVIVALVAVAMIAPDGTSKVFGNMQSAVVEGLAPYYMLVVGAFVAFAIWMGLSRYGNIKLGKDDEKAEFGLLSWFAMLFAAGMGIGLVFWGAAEPLTFFVNPKPGVTGDEADLARAAMGQTFMHWGLHAWAIYAVVGLAMAYAIHRRGFPISIRWTLEPLLGDKVKGGLGDTIDVIAVVGTLFGIATSLGLGVQQISAGLSHMGVVGEVNNTLLVVLIIIITLFALVSAVSGVGKGIKWLSNINLGLAGVFMISVLLLGPTLFIFRDLISSLGYYLQNILGMTLDTATYTGAAGQEWLGDWTIFYWGWWMSWAPFVGVFIARISRGRTVREFVLGVLAVPTIVSFIWFSIMGGTAIQAAWDDMNGGLFDEKEGIVSENVLFNMLSQLPLGGVLSVIAVLLVTIFFVTSSDSGSLVIDMLASGGDTDPPKWSRVLWASLEGLVAIALLLAGGLGALQTASILTALPVSIVIIGMCLATFKALNAEHQVLLRAERRQRRRELAREVGEGVTDELTDNFDERFGEQVDDRIETALPSNVKTPPRPWKPRDRRPRL